MRRSARWWFPMILAGVAALVISEGVVSAEQDDEDMQTITGVVSVYERDDEGQARSLFLAGTERGDLYVADNALAEEMKDYIGETVEAEGIIKDSDVEDFQLMIYVHDFFVLEEDEDMDEEEPGEDDDPSAGGLL